MERAIEKAVIVPAPIDQVWQAWTTSAGARTFFAPQARIELAIRGCYELLFDTQAPAGSQGSEGMKLLSYLPQEMLSFEWNAPPKFPNVRGERTWVVIQFDGIAGDCTLVGLTHLGWRSGEEWDRVYDYFEGAWDIVLGRLEHRFAKGPLDWVDPFTPPVRGAP